MEREKNTKRMIKVLLAGNPNVGKSTLFNSLTGMRVHTGNWAGKTVGSASARVECENHVIELIDAPGTYSLFAHSEEEKIAGEIICFSEPDVTVVVCDATSPEQNLNLFLQIAELGRKTVLCLNFADEAKKLGIKIDTDRLSELLGVKVIATTAYKKKSLTALTDAVCELYESESSPIPYSVRYPEEIEECVQRISKHFEREGRSAAHSRWLSLRLLDGGEEFFSSHPEILSGEGGEMASGEAALMRARLCESGIDRDALGELIVKTLVGDAERIIKTVRVKDSENERDRRIDKILTGKITAYPLMLILLFFVLWLTLSLANYPSEMLADIFSVTERKLYGILSEIGCPQIISGILMLGIFRTSATVVSVMLVPMAIFFPLFALLEDSGYLPRIAYNLDRPFACAGACGKQALTMCMGLGCNAVGIVGARIIDSRRERLLAILTNSLVPCNGRLPMMISLIGVFCIFLSGSASGWITALLLTLLVLLGIGATFLSTFILSKTLLKGENSSFTIELVPYRMPRFLNVTVRALRDKCLSVLLRAVTVAAPMGAIIYILANIYFEDMSLIGIMAGFFEPIGRFMGLDGVVILAFLLGSVANETVIPLMLMIYSAEGAIGSEMGLYRMADFLRMNGWSAVTALSAMLFSLFHWPCTTSLITVYKETKSRKMTLLAFLLPTVIGVLFCAAVGFFG